MSSSQLIKSSIVLMGLLVLSACSGKSRNGDGGGEPQAPPPPAPVTTQQLSDSYDNSQGMTALNSIKKSAIKNVSFALMNKDGNTSGHYVRVILSFDSSGLLSAVANIDASAFNSASNEGGLDPWSQYNNQQTTGQQLVAFKALNIPYSYNNVTGEIHIRNFIGGSASAALSNPRSTQLGLPAPQGRMGILISGGKYKSSRFFKGMSSSGYINGNLANLGTGEWLDPKNLNGFNPLSAGFDILANVAISVGEISTANTFNNTFSPSGNIQLNPTPGEFFRKSLSSQNDLVYFEPTLDPRIQ